MLKQGKLIGAINIYRQEVRKFTAKQIELVTTFAAQAVIAIDNVRLFDAEQRRAKELSEALQQQTATSEVLGVISRSKFELQPVLDAIVQTASKLCEAEFALIYRLQDGYYHPAATNNATADFVQHAIQNPIPPVQGSLIGRTALTRAPVHIPDCLQDPHYTFHEYQRSGNYRSMLGVPLMREGVAIGVIGLLRSAVKPFTDKQIALVTTFADQAVIAIENVRLFEAEQQRTRELAESLEQQTAAAEILQVISQSLSETQPVFDAIVRAGLTLFPGAAVSIELPRDGEMTAVAIAAERRGRRRELAQNFSVPTHARIHRRSRYLRPTCC